MKTDRYIESLKNLSEASYQQRWYPETTVLDWIPAFLNLLNLIQEQDRYDFGGDLKAFNKDLAGT